MPQPNIVWTVTDQHNMLKRYLAYLRPIDNLAMVTVPIPTSDVTYKTVARDIVRDAFNGDIQASYILQFIEQQNRERHPDAWETPARTLDGVRREYLRRERNKHKHVDTRRLNVTLTPHERILVEGVQSAQVRVHKHTDKIDKETKQLHLVEQKRLDAEARAKAIRERLEHLATLKATASRDFERATKALKDYRDAQAALVGVDPDEGWEPETWD